MKKNALRDCGIPPNTSLSTMGVPAGEDRGIKAKNFPNLMKNVRKLNKL